MSFLFVCPTLIDYNSMKRASTKERRGGDLSFDQKGDACIRESWIVNALIRDVTSIAGLSTRVGTRTLHSMWGRGDDKKRLRVVRLLL